MTVRPPDETTILGSGESILTVAHDIIRFTVELGPDKGLEYAIAALRTSYAAGMTAGAEIALAAIREPVQ